MSVQPIERFLNVPDLVENVFLRLDPASRSAFFQAHRDVAQNGLVVAHAKLRIELGPQSLQDQWRHVLRLTRCRPLRYLIIAGRSKQQLQDFLRCVPRGKQEEKQRVLQGKELQLQVHIKLESGGMQRIQDLIRSWCDEQQSGTEDTRVQLVLDLCGRELIATTGVVLEPPSCCTLRNGALELPRKSCVRVARDRVRFESMTLKGIGVDVVEVVSGGSLEMEGCRVEGGENTAVWVGGVGAALCAQGCSMQSSEGHGLVVCDGGSAALEHVTVGSCGMDGVRVRGNDSEVNAAHCCMDGNDWGSVFVERGARACLQHCSSNDSRNYGCYVHGQGSRLVASGSSASSNKRCGVSVVYGANASLSACTAKSNGEAGLCASSNSSLLAKACQAFDNRGGNMREVANGRITCLDA